MNSLLVVLLLSVTLVSCATPAKSPGSRVPMPTPGAVIGSTGRQIYPPAVIRSKVGDFETINQTGDKKVVELDAYRTDFNYDDPSKSNLILTNTKPAEAYLIYPSQKTFTGKLGSTNFSGSNFTLYPTEDPSCALAKGRFEWMIVGMDWNEAGIKQELDSQDMNFNPGATVRFGDKNYSYPLVPGYLVRGEGVKFVISTSSNPLGIEPIGNTTITPVK